MQLGSDFFTKYKAFITEDGSPTLIPAQPDREGLFPEKMHHSKGAFSETVYIYGSATEYVLKNNLPPQFLCVGLGLGYIELLTVALCLKQKVSFVDFYMLTYELEEDLRNEFLFWLRGENCVLQETYNQILQLTANETQIDSQQIKAQLLALYQSQKWCLEQALSLESKITQSFSCIFFDAYSDKASPELWQDDLVTKVLSQSHPSAVFATYAARGSLNRLLKSHHFTLEKKQGFGGKRESTFAYRSLRS